MTVTLQPISIEQVLSRLQGVEKSGDNWVARCPAHEDRTPSLSVSTGESGKVLLHCHAGCTFPTIVHAMGFSVHEFTGGANDPSRAKSKRNGSKPKSKIVATYDYRDESGDLLFQVCRMDPKDFRQRKPNGHGGWNWSVKNVRKVPYRLAELIAADTTAPVFIVEGEKDVDRLKDAGFIATCNAGGAGKWDKAVKSVDAFAGRRIVIIPDNDPVGAEHATSVARSLLSVASSIKIITLPDIPEKGDVSDYLENHSAGDLLALIDETAVVSAADVEAPIQKSPATKPNESFDDPHRLAREFRRHHFLSKEEENTLIFHQDNFHVWDGIRYQAVPSPEIRGQLTSFTKAQFDQENLYFLDHPEFWSSDDPPKCRKVTTGVVNNAMAALQGLAMVPGSVNAPAWLRGDQWGNPDDILPSRAGLLHLPRALVNEDCLHPPTARFYTTNGVDFAFDPLAGCPHWLAFLDSVWPDDRETIDLLQTWFGYCLSLDTRHHKLLMLIGPPRSGKGTIGRVFKGVLGAGNIACPTLGSLAGPFGLWPLHGRSVAIVADARLSGRTDAVAVVERLLSISGEDPQDIHRKNMPTLTGIRMAVRFMLMTNELPNLRDASGALTSRVLLARMAKSFLGKEDKGLDERLMSELPGILNWAILGWHRLREQGAFLQPASGRELLNELDDLASPVSQFVRECCNVGPEYQAAVDAVFSRFQGWCKEHGRDQVPTKEVFGKDLRSVLPHIRKTQPRAENGRVNVYEGVGIKLSGTG